MQPDASDRRVKPEEAELLRALVVATRPNVVVECGSFPGASTAAFTKALEEVGGSLRSYEADPELARMTGSRYVLPPPADFSDADLTFIDSQHAERRVQTQEWLKTSPPDALLLIHDANDFPRWADLNQCAVIDIPTHYGIRLVKKGT